MLGVRIYKGRLEFISKNIQWLLALPSCLTGIGIWLQIGPHMRFGFGFCLFFVMLGRSWVCWYFLRDHIRGVAKVFYAILAIVLLYNDGSFWNGIKNDFFARPLTPRVASQIVEIRDMGNGVHLSLVNYVGGWNKPLPCAPLIEINALSPKLRGTTLKAEFRARE